MDDFHDPNVIRKNFFYFLNFMYFMAGIYLWDFFTTLWFEWHCITGKRKFKWTLLLYSISRISAVATTICSTLLFNILHEINCQQLVTWTLIFGYTSFACASMLIALRVIAIWSTNRFVMLLTVGMCLTNIGFLLYGIATVRSIWSTASGSCVPENSQNTFQSRDNIIVTVSTDLAQLIIMLVGLLRFPRRKGSIARHLYNQGLIWLAAATVAEIPSAVLIGLGLNDAWSVMFHAFSFYVMVISATRMYRSLILYDMEIDESLASSVLSTELQSTQRAGDILAPSPLGRDRLDTIFGSKEERSLDERTTPDEEAQTHKIPSLLLSGVETVTEIDRITHR